MYWFIWAIGIAQIVLDPPPPLSVKRANVGKKCSKPPSQAVTRTSPPPFRECQYGNNTFQKLASLYRKENIINVPFVADRSDSVKNG